MNKNTGWIKIYRKFDEWEWFQDPKMVQIFIYILINVNTERKKWKGYTINPGQLAIGRQKLAVILGTSEQSVRTCLIRLKESNAITIKSTNKFSIISVVGWQKYQHKPKKNQPTEQPTTNQQTTNKQPTTNQPLTTTKELENISINTNKEYKNNQQKVSPACLKLYDSILPFFDERFKPHNSHNQNEWLDQLDKLNRIDGFDWDEIKNTIIWARQNDFWKANFLSIAKVRLRSAKNGETKFSNMNEQFKRSKNQTQNGKNNRQSIQKNPTNGIKRGKNDF